MLTIAVYTLDLPEYACARLRLLDPAAHLSGDVRIRLGAQSDGANYAINAKAMDGADLVIFQRYFPMAQTWPLVERALAGDAPVVYETDDNFLSVPPGHPMAARLAPVTPYARRLAELADAVTVSTPELQAALGSVAKRVVLLPNLINPALWASPGPARRGAARVVFAGTPSRADDVEAMAPVFERLQRRHGYNMELWLLGVSVPGVKAHTLPFRANYAAYAETLAGLQAHIGLAPLADNAFNRCKSNIKWLEYSALGMAGVFADLPPYHMVKHHRDGLLAGPDPMEWEGMVDYLIYTPDACARMGRQAKAKAYRQYGLAALAGQYLEAWRDIAAAGRNRG